MSEESARIKSLLETTKFSLVPENNTSIAEQNLAGNRFVDVEYVEKGPVALNEMLKTEQKRAAGTDSGLDSLRAFLGTDFSVLRKSVSESTPTEKVLKYTDVPEIIIRNLQLGTPRHAMQQFLDKLAGTVVRMNEKYGKVFCVVEFASHDEAVKALHKLDGHILKRNTLKAEFTDDYRRFLNIQKGGFGVLKKTYTDFTQKK